MHRSALGLAGRTPLSIGPEVAELARIAQADPGLLGVGERNATPRTIVGSARLSRFVAPSVVRPGIGWPPVILRRLPKSQHHQHCDAHQTQNVHPGDHQQKLIPG